MADEIIYLAGEEIRQIRPLPPYSEVVCRFLSDLSFALLHDKPSMQYPDIIAVAYWLNRKHIEMMRATLMDGLFRLGRGLAFHIAPSNIPVQFMFSYAFGLLAGNANIVRVTSKEYPQITLICNVLEKVLEKEEYRDVYVMTCIVRYPRESCYTEKFSSECQIRIVWGGDATIQSIRRWSLSPRAMEITFPDRYSLAVFREEKLERLSEQEMQKLAQDFYNDAYLMDQNACSSPQIILWQGNKTGGKERFWKAVETVVKKKYDFLPVKATGKYTDFCRNAADFTEMGTLRRHGNFLYRVNMRQLPANLDELRGRFGMFYEYDLRESSIMELDGIVNGKYQTLIYFGFDAHELAELVCRYQWLGIDRIVPVGKALDMESVWDGYDLIRHMSRIVQAE